MSLLLGEVLLRVFTPFPIHGRLSNQQAHPVLGYVMGPNLSDIDPDGFRNAKAERHADIAAIGDSHTYGFNVDGEASWPQLLSDMSGLSVYNFGVGGYGILHYKHVFEMARAKSPHSIILGLYLPNDLSDVCKLVGLQYWKQYLRENDFPPDFCPRPPGSRITYVDAIRTVLSNIAIVSALKHFVIDSTQKTDAQSTGAGAAAVTVRYGTRQTEISIPLVRSHRAGMDLSSPVIAQAHRIALLVLTEMIERSWEAGIKFAVVFIPSKQNVLFHLIDGNDPDYGVIAEAVRLERALTAQLDGFLNVRGVRTAYSLSCLQSQLNQLLFTENGDGHPVEAGYRCYAEAALSLIGDAPIVGSQPHSAPSH